MCNTVKQEMLVAIIFGGFENITIWLRFNLAILYWKTVDGLDIILEDRGWARYYTGRPWMGSILYWKTVDGLDIILEDRGWARYYTGRPWMGSIFFSFGDD